MLITLAQKGAFNRFVDYKGRIQMHTGKIRKTAVIYDDSSIPWLDSYLDCCQTISKKSTEKAKRLRTDGNKYFQKKEFDKAVELYTESLVHCPPSTELALCYGNRSAALFHLHQFQQCITDIDMALERGFPEQTRHRLHQRKGTCLLKLGHQSEARNEFSEALKLLESQENVDLKKREELLELFSEVERCEDVSPSDDKACENVTTRGSNPCLPKASALVRLHYTTEKGRHLLAADDVSKGDTLIVERPFAGVLLPDHYASHCHHCYGKLTLPFPCSQCCAVKFCSPRCEKLAWQIYHQFECVYLDVLHSIGIAHLSLRIILVAGLEKIRETRSKLMSTPSGQATSTITGLDDNGIYHTGYWSVYHLMPHTDNMVADDLFQYALTAALLGRIILGSKFLQMKQDVHSSGNTDNETTKPHPPEDNMNDLLNMTTDMNLSDVSSPNSVTPDEFDYICGLLLRHIQQLVCNAHAITELQASDVRDSVTVETNSQVRVATAIYPTASLMNHSCDPSIISSFNKDTLIVRAVKDVSKSGEIFNCYGPHHARMCRSERQEALNSQYFFHCPCSACEEGEHRDRIFQALLCESCGGPVCSKGSSLCCRLCGSVGDVSSSADRIQAAQSLFLEGLQLMEAGHFTGAVTKLDSCLSVQKAVLYRHNRDLAQTNDALARCWASLGNLEKSANFLEASLETTKLVYGESSVEVGHELSKLAGILFNGLQVAKALAVIDQSVDILQMHYGRNHNSVQELEQMKMCLLQT